MTDKRKKLSFGMDAILGDNSSPKSDLDTSRVYENRGDNHDYSIIASKNHGSFDNCYQGELEDEEIIVHSNCEEDNRETFVNLKCDETSSPTSRETRDSLRHSPVSSECSENCSSLYADDLTESPTQQQSLQDGHLPYINRDKGILNSKDYRDSQNCSRSPPVNNRGHLTLEIKEDYSPKLEDTHTQRSPIEKGLSGVRGDFMHGVKGNSVGGSLDESTLGRYLSGMGYPSPPPGWVPHHPNAAFTDSWVKSVAGMAYTGELLVLFLLVKIYLFILFV